LNILAAIRIKEIERIWTLYQLPKEGLFTMTDNIREENLKSKHEEEKRGFYSETSKEQADSEMITSVDFVFIEGEGWKLESDQ
jgi:hypothetical protein